MAADDAQPTGFSDSEKLEMLAVRLDYIELQLKQILAALYAPVVPEYDKEGKVVQARRIAE